MSVRGSDIIGPASARWRRLPAFEALLAVRYPLETALLLGLCLVLPLLEAPKSLLWLAYGIAWVANRVRDRDFGGAWDAWDSLIALYIASAFVVAAFSGLNGDEWGGAGDLLRYASVLWMVKRAGYDRRQMRWSLSMLVISTVIGVALAHAQLWPDTGSGTFELHSVGHVNHTAIYLAIMLGVGTAWVFARWHGWRAGRRAMGLAVMALVLISLMVTASRGAIGVGLALLPLLAAAWWPRSRVPLAISVAVVVGVAAAALASDAEVVRKHWDNLSKQNVLSYRDGVWRAAMTAWEQHPWFGVGMDNYRRITQERIEAWDAAAGRRHEADRYYYTTHGHSLYANTLAERGIIGTMALLALLLASGYSLVRYRPQRGDHDEHWLVWGCATSAWVVTVGAGLVNTTFHHEHGLLAALLLGLWLSRVSRPQAREAVPTRAFSG